MAVAEGAVEEANGRGSLNFERITGAARFEISII